MDMGPTRPFAASYAQAAIPGENCIPLSAEAAPGIGSSLSAMSAGVGAAAQSCPAAAEETSLPAVQDRMWHGALYLATA
jgi:hypothetical protein